MRDVERGGNLFILRPKREFRERTEPGLNEVNNRWRRRERERKGARMKGNQLRSRQLFNNLLEIERDNFCLSVNITFI